MRNRLSAIIATVALAVGLLSFMGGVLQQHASDQKVCAVVVKENASIRGLIDDFITANPAVTAKQRADADALTLARFPKHC